MTRRDFLRSATAAGMALGAHGCARGGPDTNSTSAQRTLSEHRIAEIESKRSNDRYSHFVGRGSRGGPTRFGFGRDVRIIVTDRGVRAGAMSGAKPDEVSRIAERAAEFIQAHTR